VRFLVGLIALVSASSSRDSSDRRRQSGITGRPFLAMVAAILHWRTVTGTLTYAQDRYGDRYRHYQPHPGIRQAGKKNCIVAVYALVCGPPRATRDPCQEAKAVAAYVRPHKGVIVVSELSALAGWTLPPADTMLRECVLRLPGDTRVSAQAVLSYAFPRITRALQEIAQLRRQRRVDQVVGTRIVESDNVSLHQTLPYLLRSPGIGGP
jgi:hypothetical protein